MAKVPHPGIITSLEAQTKTRSHLGERINVFIDDKFSFAIDTSLAQKRGLHRGLVLSLQALSELLREDGDARARARALHFLSYRTRSSQEVRARLEKDEWTPEVIERVLERLRGEGYLNDADFASQWVENRSLSKPRGGRMLKQELRLKGIEKEQIEAALPDSAAEIENAVAALQPRLRRVEGLEARERERKLIEFLMRRGFNYGTARAALKRLEEET